MICVDASAAVQWLLPEAHSGQVHALFTTVSAAGEQIVAPALLPFEVANVLRKRVTRAQLTQADAEQLMDQFQTLPVALRLPQWLHREALGIADRYSLPAVYDAYYVALAQRLGCDLWTDDQRLLRGLGNRLPFVRWIGDFPMDKR
jgi:predicted nucleic acid-binding protein